MKIAVPYPLSAADANLWGELGEVHLKDAFLKDPKSFDLMTLAGGADVMPALYGHKNLDSSCHPQRDEYERRCIEAALEHGVPIAGICRGLQILTALLGGTLVQDLGPDSGHGRTKVETLDGEEFTVASSHHQMALPPAGQGEILAWNKVRGSPDAYKYGGPKSDLLRTKDEEGNFRVVQAVAYPEQRIFATQFHPEWMPYGSPGQLWAIKMVRRYCLRQEEGQCLEA